MRLPVTISGFSTGTDPNLRIRYMMEGGGGYHPDVPNVDWRFPRPEEVR
jgi:hypothetical protein